MKSRLKHYTNSLLRVFGFEITTRRVSTHRKNIAALITDGTDREWRQIAMYSNIMNLVKEVPGDIAEFGVAGGDSFLSFARLVKIYNTEVSNPVGKKNLHGFDTFSGLPYFDEKKDAGHNRGKDMRAGGFDASGNFDWLSRVVEKFDNVFLYKGLFEDTVPKFLEKNGHLALSLIHIDCDLHDSTVAALGPTIQRLSVGGVILFDEIFHRDFPGETSGFWEVYNKISGLGENFKIEFQRVPTMPWKWYAVRVY